MVFQRDGKKMLALVLIGINVFLAASGQISMKTGMNQVGDVFEENTSLIDKTFSTVTNPFVLFGVFLYVISLAFWLVILSKLDVSFAYPLVALSYIVTAALAFVFLKESITVLRWAGIIFVVIGSWLIVSS